ncbi:PepSY domain-containing protein [Candidatus Rariloculus sp.]|uniref:PepSY domain-containing protein n=1 Tax=Candidatus Rariloculus sp. TaxID=3101265 RepID=UPI003D0DAE23
MRWLIALHRWMGIGLGWLLVAWCISGVVMMYVPYPEVSFEEYVESLPNLEFGACCGEFPTDYDPGYTVSGFAIEMLADQPVLRVIDSFGGRNAIDLGDGEPVRAVPADAARAIATRMSTASRVDGRLEYLGTVSRDQWTVAGNFDRDRPLHHFSLNDPEGNEWYLSSTTGELVQQSTRRERVWGWFGSVTHWLYPTLLRQNARLWSEVVIWSTVAGLFLAVFGTYIGIKQLRRRRNGRWSPYRGMAWWHHTLGLVFGVLALTWLLSGLFSMNPWGLLEGSSARSEVERVRGTAITLGDAMSWAAGLARYDLPAEVTRVESAPLLGRAFLMAYGRNGYRARLAAETLHEAPLGEDELHAAAGALLDSGTSIAAAELLEEGDAYYFNHHVTRPFPVYRVIADDDERTHYYLDGMSGQLVSKIDSGRRWFRWLHLGLHRLDFTATMRSRPIWDVLMLVLMAGVTAICITGTYMGVKYLARRE